MSVASLGFATPPLERIEYHVDRRKAAGVAVTAILAGGLIASPALTQWHLIDEAGKLTAAVVALAGAAVMVMAGVFITVRLLLRRDALVVIDADGIHDRRTSGAPLPWSRIHDIRVLDRHGRHIGIETRDENGDATCSGKRRGACAARPGPITVIDTFFLRAASGNRFLDFILPITALAPIDMSETPVSADTLSADARMSRRRVAAVSLFIIAVAAGPGAAALLLASI